MSIQACAEMVARDDPQRFRAVMTLPVPERERWLPVLAMNLEVVRAVWGRSEPMMALMRLQFWRDQLDAIDAGQAVAGHDVAQALATVSELNTEALRDVISARETDIDRVPFASPDALFSYADATSGRLLEAVTGENTAGRALGRADGVARLILAAPALERSGTPLIAEESEELWQAIASRALDERAEVLRSAPKSCVRLTATAPLILAGAAKTPAKVMQGELAPSEFGLRMALWKSLFTGR